jgi:2-phosphoglycerate kinase
MWIPPSGRTLAEALLVVVSGLPGSGKTTLARTIGARLSVPVVERDRLAEVCFDAVGAESPAVAQLGSVSYELSGVRQGGVRRAR